MSDIKVGDLVMVVRRSPCGCERRIGTVFKVGEVGIHRGGCIACGNTRTVPAAYNATRHTWTDLTRLKRIDPPAEGDSFTVKLPKKQPVEA